MTIVASEQLPFFGNTYNFTHIQNAHVWGGRSGVDGEGPNLFQPIANTGDLFIFRGQLWRCTTAGNMGDGDIGTPPSPTGSARFAQISTNLQFGNLQGDTGVTDLTDTNNAATAQFRYSGTLLTTTVGALVSDGYRIFQIIASPVVSSGGTNYYAALENTFYFRFVRFANRYRMLGGSSGATTDQGGFSVRYTLTSAVRASHDVDEISGFGVTATQVRIRRFSSSDQVREDETIDLRTAMTFKFRPSNTNEQNNDYWLIEFSGANITVRQLIIGDNILSIPEPKRIRGGTSFDGQDRSQTAGNLIGILQERVTCKMHFTPPNRAEGIWRELGSVQGRFLSWDLDGLLISGNLEVWRTRDTDAIGELDISVHGRNAN